MTRPWKIALGLAAVLILLGVPLLSVVASRYAHRGVAQPIAYNHKVHVSTAGMNCVDCHQHVETAPAATIPGIEVCQTCHSDQPLTESPEEAKLLGYVKEKKEIPWQQVYNVPDHVYFSHPRHVVDGGIECASCHGTMTELAEPVTFPSIEVTMENCLRCHTERKISTDCLTCHI